MEALAVGVRIGDHFGMRRVLVRNRFAGLSFRALAATDAIVGQPPFDSASRRDDEEVRQASLLATIGPRCGLGSKPLGGARRAP